MPVKNSFVTVTDQFCGAGGSSQGAVAAGAEVLMALNHWKRAIETHQTNFPNTAHDCTDISACDPRRYPSTHILITSPECTTHSPAGGNTHKAVKKQMDLFDTGKADAATERSRATMWDVCRFAEYHKYESIVVENVVEALTRWALFDVWLMAMHKLGYNHKCCFLNSMHFHPTPQSRDRMYIVFWKKGNKAPDLEYMPKAYCPICEKDVQGVQSWKNKLKKYGKYKTQYRYCCPACSTIIEPYYYAAFNCIDWSDGGKRIGDRKKPLSPNSERRVKLGIEKFGNEPFLFHTSYGTTARNTERHIGNTMLTQTTQASQALIQQPFLINDQHSTGMECRIRGAGETVPTLSTQPHIKVIMPYIIQTDQASHDNIRQSLETLQTQTTRQTMAVVSPPVIIEHKGNSNARESTKPLSTLTTTGYHGIITDDAWRSFIGYYYNGSDMVSRPTDALGGVNTHDRHFLINYQKPSVEDCYYRMLKPHEIKIAMAFGRQYVVTGNGKEQVKQLGNAVTPPAMEWLVKQCVNALSS